MGVFGDATRRFVHAKDLCPHGFESCTGYRFRYTEVSNGTVLTWTKGSMEDMLSIRLERCVKEYSAARHIQQRFLEQGHCVRMIWSETLQQNVSLISKQEITAYLDRLREEKSNVEDTLCLQWRGRVKEPGRRVYC